MDELTTALDVLRALVRDGFGPSAHETLLFAPPDAPVITAHGRTVLAAWRRSLRENCVDAAHSSPMQLFVLDAAEGLSLLVGDGASEFVLLIHSAATHAVDAVRGAQHGGATLRRQLAGAIGDVRRECAHLLDDCNTWRPGLRIATRVSMTQADDSTALTPSSEFHTAITSIITSGLAGLLGTQALPFIIALVIEWLFTPALVPHTSSSSSTATADVAQLYARAEQLHARAPDAIVFTLASSIYGSQVVPLGDYILRKALVPTQRTHALFTASSSLPSPLHFVCLTAALTLADGANHVTLVAPTTAALFAATGAPRAFATSFVAALRRRYNVQLLVTTEALDDAVVAVCARLGVACVQLAERSDVLELCTAAVIAPIASVFLPNDDSETFLTRYVGVCRGGISCVRLQQSPWLWFHSIDRTTCTSNHTVVPQLLLHAPTRSVFHQYSTAVVKALRILRSWWTPSPSASRPTINATTSSLDGREQLLQSCRGGGATELALATQLDALADREDDSACNTGARASQQLARRIVATALRDVVAQLHSNVSSALGVTSNRSSSIQARRSVLRDVATCSNDVDAPICGYVLDTQRVVVVGDEQLAVCVPTLRFCDPLATALLHPWRRIDALVALTLETLEQLLRVDCIVHVAGRLAVPSDDDSDSD